MDIRLHYVERGAGNPLIMLHGNGENSDYFASQIEFFSQFYRVIAVDTRGHGKSPRGSAPFSIGQFAEDLACFMDEHSIEKADILGFSDGGNIALTFALKYPHRVDRLILNGANLNARGVKPSIQIPIVIGYRIASLISKWDEKARRKAEFLGLMVNDPSIPASALDGLYIKTLVITGTNDMIRDSHTRLIAEHLPDCVRRQVKGDHFIAAKNPDEYNRVVYEFLNT